MTRYSYSGPATGYELDGQEHMARPGDKLDLPPDHPLTVGWRAHRYLTEIPAEAKAAPAKRAVKED
jgi:hypothetical protein